ncbi:G2/mitotic-specific cyclin [Ophidiomyces ophidiicola]|uniref:G2/mitotic-specific cyclin n=1 Tax=Ophidiomyces ophidiicola TaxID=1387563 RepID=A0ACB8V1L2_9EURO|nr:G2/mitotic-specific cyclin [Ophidiomyces ophidiicola]KAI1912517.1 G2/mitotic-specific cyclin [Ophidiomyces ophidiicola]KAI1914657.1 G2/mitotic-specific cyclin [Ophidiomyces ophidiicola]KAI1930881.1 G2/mitotic-specific cyclin [Ophidiomyces ophidiicola]KAI1946809.1 G2/mitotic-specific cyclin [Ophidiomyces ophidiicola]KAI1962152.1 G2/mitotic-specific cyclin [Ophidiomyces ophidiicola]
MPPARSLRQRAVNNENDENAVSTRLTRAKAAALAGPEGQVNISASTKALQSKSNALTAATTGAQRKRAALGDVSNVTKTETVDVKESKEVKKATGSRAALTSKASTQTGGIQKITRNNTSRSALGARDVNKREAEAKRPASGSGVMGGTQLKRPQSQKTLTESESNSTTEEPPRKKVDSGKKTTIFKECVKAGAESADEAEEALDDDEQELEQIVDLDAEDAFDPLMVSEYVVEIFDYLRDIEPHTMPCPDYIDYQEELEWKMRGILVDWLIEVHTRFRLLPETLFLTVNIIDRFLSIDMVALDRLQLVGVAAMFIAAKYEEVLSPHVATFSHVADDTFSDKEILDAERHILATLNYDISYPNPMNFLRRISKADNYDVQTRTFGKFLMEISLLDHRFMGYRQSHIAAAAMYFARLILERGPWDSTISYYAGYTKEEILPVFHLMVDYLYRPVAHEAFHKKYASKRFLKASLHARHWAKKYRALYLRKDDTRQQERQQERSQESS